MCLEVWGWGFFGGFLLLLLLFEVFLSDKLWKLKFWSEAFSDTLKACWVPALSLLYQESQEGIPGLDPCKMMVAVVPLTLHLGVGGDKVLIFDTGHLEPCLGRCRAVFSPSRTVPKHQLDSVLSGHGPSSALTSRLLIKKVQ